MEPDVKAWRDQVEEALMNLLLVIRSKATQEADFWAVMCEACVRKVLK